MRRSTVFSAAILIACIFPASRASAAPPYVDRGITLPRHDWSFDIGLGIGHRDFNRDINNTYTGAGLNFEMAVAVIQHLELGFRSGLRFGNEGAISGADQYGRLFDRQTYATGGDTFANPEFRIRGALVHGDIVELALEGRAVPPIEHGTDFGAQFGMPVFFHFGRAVRLDTGVYIPIIFGNPTATAISAPIDVWIQCTDRLWLGPMSGLRLNNPTNRLDVSLGFGLGYQITHAVDFKTMFLVPRINETAGARNFGAGAGVQIRIE
jgi:hypothetical protein